jgi:hypothetical protein
MPLNQGQPITPPTPGDQPALIAYTGNVQRNAQALFSAAHVHVGANGPITEAPKASDGNAGDITIGLISGALYLFVKADRTHWYQFGPGTAL